jgi:hypothetical protein
LLDRAPSRINEGNFRPSLMDGPRTDVSDITGYAYYVCTTGSECGHIHTSTDAAGRVTTYNTYNRYGQPLTITDSNGVVTTLTYDTRQQESASAAPRFAPAKRNRSRASAAVTGAIGSAESSAVPAAAISIRTGLLTTFVRRTLPAAARQVVTFE